MSRQKVRTPSGETGGPGESVEVVGSETSLADPADNNGSPARSYARTRHSWYWCMVRSWHQPQAERCPACCWHRHRCDCPEWAPLLEVAK